MKASAVEIIVEETFAAAAQRAVERIAAIITESTSGGEDCYVSLCGGGTPGKLYRRLAAPPLSERIPWQRVHVFFGDERDVPADNVENNYRMVAENLLDHVPVLPAQVHPMCADCNDLPAAADQYEHLIRRLVPAEVEKGPAGGADAAGTPCFDLILLGMGGNGHTASLFPDTPALAEKSRLVVSQFVPLVGRNRLTFTFPLINAARNVMFFVTGADKADAVAAVLSGQAELQARYPAGQVRPTHGKLIFVLDTPAAKQIQPSSA